MVNGKLTSRACNERYEKLKKNYKTKRGAEERASGIAPDEPTECEKLLDDLMEREADVEVMKNIEQESEKNKKDREIAQAKEIRERSMETIGETMDRGKGKKRKSSTEIGDLMEHLRKKSENEREMRMKVNELKEKEIENRRRELDLRETELELQRECMERSCANMRAILGMQQALMDKLVEKI